LTFDFEECYCISQVAIRNRGDAQGAKIFTVEFALDLNGPWGSVQRFETLMTTDKQMFGVKCDGSRFCRVTFVDNFGATGGSWCTYIIHEFAFF